MKVCLTSMHHFAAAHRLHNDARAAEWNRRVFDKCNNDHGHGHTYGLEVTVEGEIDPETGYVMDFKELKRIVEERVVRIVERRHLNFDVDFLKGINPTAENIAVAIWKRLAGSLPGAELKRVTLHETGKNSVVFEG
ncbi:MAG TPA: 6-carboxytetrahydropterin synthase [Thermoanaerobaculia bacterium]|jgi:6-pyruvoyltetrahydropterin/6-carboxytetrahydropterin synthase|nr:6-carboxytetrahydropterin synthase [Thermoanaerobaculia bacterium]